MSARPATKDCPVCHAFWQGRTLLTAGKIWNGLCQECGYDARIHGVVGAVYTINEFGEPQP